MTQYITSFCMYFLVTDIVASQCYIESVVPFCTNGIQILVFQDFNENLNLTMIRVVCAYLMLFLSRHNQIERSFKTTKK